MTCRSGLLKIPDFGPRIRVSLCQDSLQDILNSINGILYRIGYVRMRCIHEALNRLQGIPNLIVHPANGLETSQGFDSAFARDQLPAIHKNERQEEGDRTADNPHRTTLVKPVVVNKPLEANRNEEHGHAAHDCDEPERNDRRNLG